MLKITKSSNVSALRASITDINHTAKAKQTLTISEELIWPSAKDIYHEPLEQAAAQKVAHVPLWTAPQLDKLMK